MKKFVLVVLLILLPAPSQALDLDKKQHIVASALIFGAAYLVTEDIKTSALIALGAGLGKELYDSAREDGFDTKDLAADVVGIGIGVLWVKQF